MYSSEFMFPEYPSIKELYAVQMDVKVARLNCFMDDNETTNYELYESLKVYKRMLQEFQNSYNDMSMVAM